MNCRAAGLGLEPRYTVPETAVLPLDDPANTSAQYCTTTLSSTV